jgi:transcription elongation factor Elf1
MAAKTEKSKSQPVQPEEKPLVFTCKFCGETKPLSELVIMRQYYPQLAACKDCSRIQSAPLDKTAETAETPDDTEE